MHPYWPPSSSSYWHWPIAGLYACNQANRLPSTQQSNMEMSLSALGGRLEDGREGSEGNTIFLN